jgi:hypothetical protein
LPWASTVLALAGNVLLGFTVACVGRTRTGEPGAAASAAVVVALILPGLVPPVSRWVSLFPSRDRAGLSCDALWCAVLAACVVAIAASVSQRRLPRRLLGLR